MSTLRNKNLAQAVRECGEPPCAMAFELDADECVCVCRMDQEMANPVGKGRRGARSKGMKFPRRRKGQTWQQYHDQLAGLAAKSSKAGRTAESYGYQVAAKMVAKRHHDDVMASRPAGYRAAGPGTLSWDDCMKSLRQKHPTWTDERCRKVCGSIRAKSKRMYPAYWGTGATRNPSPPQHERIGEEALTQGIKNLRVALAFSGKNLHLDVPSKFVAPTDEDVDEIDQQVRGHDDESRRRILAVAFKLLMAIVQIAVAENSFKMASPRKPSKNQQLSGKALRIAAEEMRALSTRFRSGGDDRGVANPSERQHEQNKERLENFIGDLVDRAFHGQMPDVYAGMRSVDSYIAYLCLVGALVANDVGPDLADNEAFIPVFVLRPPEGNIYARTIAQPVSYLHASVAPRKKKDPKQWNPAARGLHAAGGGHRPRAAGNQPRYRCTTLDRKGHRTAAWETTLEESMGSLSKLGLDDMSVNQMTCIALRDGGMLYVRRIA